MYRIKRFTSEIEKKNGSDSRGKSLGYAAIGLGALGTGSLAGESYMKNKGIDMASQAYEVKGTKIADDFNKFANEGYKNAKLSNLKAHHQNLLKTDPKYINSQSSKINKTFINAKRLGNFGKSSLIGAGIVGLGYGINKLTKDKPFSQRGLLGGIKEVKKASQRTKSSGMDPNLNPLRDFVKRVKDDPKYKLDVNFWKDWR